MDYADVTDAIGLARWQVTDKRNEYPQWKKKAKNGVKYETSAREVSRTVAWGDYFSRLPLCFLSSPIYFFFRPCRFFPPFSPNAEPDFRLKF